jgi:hypothetical protein
MHPIVDDLGMQGQHAAFVEQGWQLSQDEHFCADMEDDPLGNGRRKRVLLSLGAG